MERSNIDVNKPVTNPKLVDFLEQREHMTPDDAGWDQLMNNILQCIAEDGVFLAVTEIDKSHVHSNGDGTVTFEANTIIQFESLSTPDGKTYFPIYTDWENLRANPKYQTGDVETVIFRLEDIASMSDRDSGAVLNPFTHNLLLDKVLLNHLMQVKNSQGSTGVTQQVVEHDTKVMLGEPAEYPTQMVEAIKDYAKTDKAIKAIYLKLMIKEGEKSYLLIIDFDGDRKATFEKIAKAGQPYLPAGMFIDMIPYTDDFGRKAAYNKPFYKRNTSKLFGLFDFRSK